MASLTRPRLAFRILFPRGLELFRGWGNPAVRRGVLGDHDPFKEFTSDPFHDRQGPGHFSCQTYAISAEIGEDGKVHTERYASSHVGDREHGIREAQHAYSNSATGVTRTGLERHLGDRAMKYSIERDANKKESSTRMFHGMDESGRDAFEQDFRGKAQHLPPHRGGGRRLFEVSDGWQGALPQAPQEQEQQQQQQQHQVSAGGEGAEDANKNKGSPGQGHGEQTQAHK